jgi:hypothetical protein
MGTTGGGQVCLSCTHKFLASTTCSHEGPRIDRAMFEKRQDNRLVFFEAAANAYEHTVLYVHVSLAKILAASPSNPLFFYPLLTYELMYLLVLLSIF